MMFATFSPDSKHVGYVHKNNLYVQSLLDLGITQRNFRGRGQDVRARVSVGSLRQQLDFSFTEPRFTDRDVAATFAVYGYRYDLSDYSAYKTTTFGSTISANFPLSIDMRGALRYTLRQDDIQISGLSCNAVASGGVVLSSALCDQVGKRLTSSVGYGARWDRRNDYLNPTRGFYFDFNQDVAGLGGEVNYVKTDFETGWFHGFTKDIIFSIVGSTGYVFGWGGDTVRINDRYYKAASTSAASRRRASSPRDVSGLRGDALGGKACAIGTVELTVPTFLPTSMASRPPCSATSARWASWTRRTSCTRPATSTAWAARSRSRPTPPCRSAARGARLAQHLHPGRPVAARVVGVSIFWKSPMGRSASTSQGPRQSPTTAKKPSASPLQPGSNRHDFQDLHRSRLPSAIADQAPRQPSPRPGRALPPAMTGAAINGICVFSDQEVLATSTVGRRGRPPAADRPAGQRRARRRADRAAERRQGPRRPEEHAGSEHLERRAADLQVRDSALQRRASSASARLQLTEQQAVGGSTTRWIRSCATPISARPAPCC